TTDGGGHPSRSVGVPIEHRHRRALTGEERAQRGADAGTGTGDERRSTGEAVAHDGSGVPAPGGAITTFGWSVKTTLIDDPSRKLASSARMASPAGPSSMARKSSHEANSCTATPSNPERSLGCAGCCT